MPAEPSGLHADVNESDDPIEVMVIEFKLFDPNGLDLIEFSGRS
jgi:hypothetical protein